MLEPRYFGPRSTPLENRMVGDFVSTIIWGNPGEIVEYCSMGVFDGEELVAGTLYHNWHPENGIIELTSASKTKRWLTKPVVNAMFNCAFVNLDCQMAVLRVSERNTNMVHIARSFGFNEYFIPRLRGRDENEYVFTFTDDQWRESPYNKSPLGKAGVS